jgi:hypothetical protein
MSYSLPFAGSYTVAVGGFQSTTSGSYGYSMSFVAQPIPEPEIAVLLAGGLCAIAVLRRRAKRSVANREATVAPA